MSSLDTLGTRLGANLKRTKRSEKETLDPGKGSDQQ